MNSRPIEIKFSAVVARFFQGRHIAVTFDRYDVFVLPKDNNKQSKPNINEKIYRYYTS